MSSEVFQFGPYAWDIDLAIKLLQKRKNKKLEHVNVKDVYTKSTMSMISVDEKYALEKTDLNKPLIFGMLKIEGNWFSILIDGHHRLFRANKESIDKLPAYFLTKPENYKISIGWQKPPKKNPIRGDERISRVERGELPGDPKLEVWRRGFVVPPDIIIGEPIEIGEGWGNTAVWIKPGFKYNSKEGANGRWIRVVSLVVEPPSWFHTTGKFVRLYEVAIPAPHFKILKYQTYHDTHVAPDWEDPELQKLVFQAYITSDTPSRKNPDEASRRKLRDAAVAKDYKALNAAKLGLWRTTGIIEPDFVEEYKGKTDLFPHYGIGTKEHPGSEVRIWNLGNENEDKLIGNEDKLIITAERRRRIGLDNIYYWNIDAVRQYFIPEKNLVTEDFLFEFEVADSLKPNWNHINIQKEIYKAVENSLTRRNPDESSRRKERESLGREGKLSDVAKIAKWRSGQPVPPDLHSGQSGYTYAWKLGDRTVALFYRVHDIDLGTDQIAVSVDLYYKGFPLIHFLHVISNYVPTLKGGDKPEFIIPWDSPIIQERIFEILTDSITYQQDEQLVDRGLQDRLKERSNPDENSRRKLRKSLASEGKLSEEAKAAMWRSGQIPPPERIIEEERNLTHPTRLHKGSELREWSLENVVVIVTVDRIIYESANDDCITCYGTGFIASEYPHLEEDCPDCGDQKTKKTEWIILGNWHQKNSPEYKLFAFNFNYPDSELPPWDDKKLQEAIYSTLIDKRRNPLIITDFMRQWRLENKVSVVVKMSGESFLKLTTADDEHLEEIIKEVKPLEEYNVYANCKDMAPIHLDILLREERNGVVIGHNGRHRVAAMLENGESDVEVSLRFFSNLGLSRKYSILDLPIFIFPQFPDFERKDYVFDSFQGISEVIETNVQFASQKAPQIENKSLTGFELRKLLRRNL